MFPGLIFDERDTKAFAKIVYLNSYVFPADELKTLPVNKDESCFFNVG